MIAWSETTCKDFGKESAVANDVKENQCKLLTEADLAFLWYVFVSRFQKGLAFSIMLHFESLVFYSVHTKAIVWKLQAGGEGDRIFSENMDKISQLVKENVYQVLVGKTDSVCSELLKSVNYEPLASQCQSTLKFDNLPAQKNYLKKIRILKR